ncbi:MAG: F0F1 ATP synthase subunit epsilon, partial [Anaerolineae bacterium]|nr:F0F1 ATP synthase subunit epsilon [Anaerolineae bacterium]
MPLEVEVISRVRRLYHTDRADMVIIPGSEGELGVLPNHTPLLTTLAFGELRIV